ncbi:MAG: hypothetical protein KGY54_13525, partial [Oleiphilaceae bacterium]|nr:hypothetical protein [Oleiphilaceae bacterium]
ESWALVAMSGSKAHQPERHQCQGPYRSLAQAEAMLRGVAGSLLGKSYEAEPEAHVVWSVVAQRIARRIRRDREAYSGVFRLGPDQYEPIE